MTTSNSMNYIECPAGGKIQPFAPSIIALAQQHLAETGHCMLRGFAPSKEGFSELMQTLCSSVSYDPARAPSEDGVQKVDAGTLAIGLHIENGNTPNVPQLAAFFSEKAARKGSCTTVCDGALLLRHLDDELREYFSSPVTVTRRLPKHLWQAYVASEMPGKLDAASVTQDHVKMAASGRDDVSISWHDDESLTLGITFDPIRKAAASDTLAFANALLGPSFNYEPPLYTFGDGREVSDDALKSVADEAEKQTLEINWQDGDIALIDNWRVMHGRRAIEDADRRVLHIGLGTLR